MSTVDTNAETYTIAEAASILRVTERTLRRWIKAGQMSAVKVKGARGDEWRIDAHLVLSMRDVKSVSMSSVDDRVQLVKSTVDNALERLALIAADSAEQAVSLYHGRMSSTVQAQEDLLKGVIAQLGTHEQVIALQTQLIEEQRKVNLLQDRLKRARSELEEYRRLRVVFRRPIPWEERKGDRDEA